LTNRLSAVRSATTLCKKRNVGLRLLSFNLSIQSNQNGTPILLQVNIAALKAPA